ncbi:MAG: hypothetical protein GEV06_15930 [Luteitalea sp.]|nr:hypothetical protein [Luteitalea sp.]
MLERIGYALQKGREVERTLVGIEPFGQMIDLLAILPPEIPLPEIVVESENQIGLDWDEGSRRVLTLTVDDTQYVGFAALIGHEPLYGRVPLAGQIPETVAYLFRRLYPSSILSEPILR